MKHIILFYNAGLFGNWFSYFVNLHNGFERSDILLHSSNGPCEYSVDSAIRITGTKTHGKRPKNIYTASRDSYGRDISDTSIYSNIPDRKCFIMQEFHYCSSFIHNADGKARVYNYINSYDSYSVIALYAEANQEIIRSLKKRNIEMFGQERDLADPIDYMAEIFADNILLYDITRLIGLEDRAYYELCDFLKTEPIANWKDIVDDMVIKILNNL